MGSGTWIKLGLLSGAVIVWQIVELATTVEAQPPALLVLQYAALVLAAIALVGSIIMLVRGRAGRA